MKDYGLSNDMVAEENEYLVTFKPLLLVRLCSGLFLRKQQSIITRMIKSESDF
jgi:hypothetical protein